MADRGVGGQDRVTLHRNLETGEMFYVQPGRVVISDPQIQRVEFVPAERVRVLEKALEEKDDGWERLTDLCAECRHLAGVLRQRGTEEDRATAETLLDITGPYLAQVAEVFQDA